MTLKFGKRTLFIGLFAVFATLCMVLAFIFLVPSSKTASAESYEHSSHDSTWTRLTTSDSLSTWTSGKYYLYTSFSGRIIITADDNASLDIILCLNGNTLNGASESKYVITVGTDVNLTICDCKGTGRIKNGSFVEYGVYVDKYATFTLAGGTITKFKSKKNVGGGAVYVANYGTFNMVGGTITKNSAKYDNGGAVYVDNKATFNMSGGTISDNTAKKGDGGAVYVDYGGTFNMSDGTISNNTAKKGNGGGVYVAGGGTFEMSGGTITKNTAKKGDGGGVYVNGIFTMTGGTISDNTAKYNGGGVYLGIATMFSMNSAKISSNTATDGDGGGVYVADSATFNMTDSKVSNNTSKYNGGGVYVHGGVFTMSYVNSICQVFGNTSTHGYGGGVSISGASASSISTFTMSRSCWIESNTVKKHDGGGVYVGEYAEFTMSGGYILYNTALKKHLGGGVAIFGGTFTMSGGYIRYNTANWGGGVWLYYGEFNMTGGQIEHNTTSSTHKGGGVWVSGGTFTMAGTTAIIGSNCSTYYDGSGVYVSDWGTFIMKSGYINDWIGKSKYSDSSITITGGYFSARVTLWQENYSNFSLFIADGYEVYSTGHSTYIYGVRAEEDTSTYDSEQNAEVEYDYYFTELGGTLSSGTFCLFSDVTLLEDLVITSGTEVYINLNGYIITGTGNDSVITVEDGATLVLYDTSTKQSGGITGGNASSGGGINVCSGGTLIMDGGVIFDNTASKGGGIFVAGTFTMNGGTIKSNTASVEGDGVRVASTGTFTMTGGEISDTVGIYIYNGTASIEGGILSTKIWNNRGTLTLNGGYYSGTYGNNYGTLTVCGGYFSSTAYSSFKSGISSQFSAVDLTEFYSVYGSMPDSNYSADYPYAVYSKGEYSISNITVTYGDSYTVKVGGTYVEAYAIYTYNGYTDTELPTEAGTYEVTATIITKSSDCTLRADTITLTIVIQQKELAEDMFSITGTYIYNGTEQKATYTYEDTDGDNAVLTESDFDVTYSYNTSAGTATVTFTGKGNYSGEVTLTYEIEKADYDTSGSSLTNKTVTYNGSAQTLTVSGTLPTGVTVTYYYEGTNGTTYERTTTAPTNAGYYTVTAVFSGDENYNSISSLTADLTIEKASYDTSSLTLQDVTVTYNGEAQAVAVSGLPDGVEVTVYYTGAYSTVYEKTMVAPTEAGIYFVTAVFSGDFDNYNAISKLTSTLTIEKAATEAEALNITAHVGDSLEDIELPEGWTWSDTATFSSSGEYVVYATYCAGDNYETVTTAVTVSVTGYSSSDKLGIAAIVIGCATFAVCASVITLFFFKKKKV